MFLSLRFTLGPTYRILRANEKIVEAMHEQAVAVGRPYVIVGPVLEVDNPIFYLRVSNTGNTAAQNLRLTIDKPFFKFGEKGERNNLATFSLFNQPIESFPPGSEITFSLAQGFKVFAGDTKNRDMPHTFSITANRIRQPSSRGDQPHRPSPVLNGRRASGCLH